MVSALDVNALLDQVDLNAVLDQVDMDRVLDRIDLDRLLERMDLNDLVKRIDVEALVKQTDLGAVIAASSSGVAGDVLDVVRSQTVGLDEFIARWIGRLRRRPYTGPPGPPVSRHVLPLSRASCWETGAGRCMTSSPGRRSSTRGRRGRRGCGSCPGADHAAVSGA